MSTIPLHSDVYPAIEYSVTAGTLENKVAVIAGASRGIGQQIAHSLAKAGANVALLSLSGENIETKRLCEQEGVKAVSWKVDLTDVPETKRVFNEIVKELGVVDILVNNAGMQRRRPFAMDTVEDWWRVVEVNLKGPMCTTAQVLQSMRERNSGCIINIGSRAGTVNAPFATPYFTSKAGLLRVTACLQLEQEMDGITGVSFYCLHPGGVRTHSHTDPSTHTLTMILTEDAYADDVREKYPEMVARYQEFQKRFIDSGYLCGQTCAFIAAGKALPLRGKYFDVEQDISKVLEYAPEFAKKGLYDLKVEFAGGLLNDGGTTADTMSQKQQKK